MSSVALKQKLVVGGVLAGLGAFLGQRAVSCGRSLPVARAVAVVMLDRHLCLLFIVLNCLRGRNMGPRSVADGVYWVGVNDRVKRLCEAL